MIVEKILIALLMMLVATLIHAFFMIAGHHILESRLARLGPQSGHCRKAVVIWLLTVWMFLAIIIEAMLWALVYLKNPGITELPDLQTAMYFSIVTFTTLGYGDVVLGEDWRVLASIQAASGVIIFGWTTALIFYFIQRVYRHV